jgi:tRNA pseudouridine38-40 synthase
MPRYRLLVEYDGRPFSGFQAQADRPTVQGAIEAAVLAFSGETVRLAASGRTDAGVHALGQVVHIDLARTWRPDVVRDAINAHLFPQPVAVLAAEIAAEGWHARFSARERRYLYRILNRRGPPALLQGKVWHMKKQLDWAAMHDAAQTLLGLHDFTTFRDLQCQSKSPVKTIDFASVEGQGEEIVLEFRARSFLHRQVRSMAGSLVEVGIGRWTKADFVAALEAKDRRACGPVAPADGLYFAGVSYEDPHPAHPEG